MELVEKKIGSAFEALKGKLGITNTMQTPQIVKIVVATGVGRVTDKKKLELIENRLATITGQKASPRTAKKSIASFKTRKGQTIGYQVTLRGKRMRDFFERLISIALPRTRDFRGISRMSVDPMGNLSIGIREHTIFPETADEDLRDVFGLSVTIVSSVKSRDHAIAFFEHIGIPFNK